MHLRTGPRRRYRHPRVGWVGGPRLVVGTGTANFGRLTGAGTGTVTVTGTGTFTATLTATGIGVVLGPVTIPTFAVGVDGTSHTTGSPGITVTVGTNGTSTVSGISGIIT